MKKTNEKLRRAYKAVVNIPEESIKALEFLSKTMIHLWNMAVGECESRLTARTAAYKAVTAYEKGGTASVVSLPDGREIPVNETTIPEIKKTFSGHARISAYALNYWLTGKRQEIARLGDGTAVPLSEISVDAEREVLRKLAGSYQSYFELRKKNDERARRPGPKKEGWFQTLSWSSFQIQDGILTVPGRLQSIRIPVGDYLAHQITGKDTVHATLAKNRDGGFELSLVTAAHAPKPMERPTFFRAIDLGAGDVAVSDSDGSEFLIPTRRPDKFWQGKVVPSIEGRAVRKIKGSRRYRRLMEARRDVFEKSRHQHIDYQRKLAAALLEEKVQCVIIGKPKTRLGLARTETSPKLHYGAQNTGYLFRLLIFLKNKAVERGVRVLEIRDPRRKGGLDDPENKFKASRQLLEAGLKETGITMPASFVRKGFRFSYP